MEISAAMGDSGGLWIADNFFPARPLPQLFLAQMQR